MWVLEFLGTVVTSLLWVLLGVALGTLAIGILRRIGLYPRRHKAGKG